MPGRNPDAAIRGDIDTFASSRSRVQASISEARALEIEEFTATAAHDLNEPLRAIVGFAELLQRHHGEELGYPAVTWMDGMLDAAGQMRALIESLLMYSRSGAGPHRITSVDLEEVTRAASWTFRDVVDDARATLDIGSMPRVEGDETQLVQVMRNLVGNALKFVHPDIPVQVRIDAECDDEGWCVVSVVDTGIGIRPEHCERVFLPFHRVETGLRHAGTGLGLSICRRIVERHGGSIWVDEVPTGGTCIRFSLPLARDPK